MIVRGHTATKVTALRMTKELDEGPIYLQRDASLAGTANEIFTRVSHIIQEMIVSIIETSPVPYPQVGEPTVFKRRTPDQSVLPEQGSLSQVYDHIRMLDGEGYPKAFLKHGDFIIEFDAAQEREGSLEARAVIRKLKGD
jgi:methionyl-tRNA formyltransferase